MDVEKTDIDGVLLITPQAYLDERGLFFEAYVEERYEKLGIPRFVQDNESLSRKDVLRGLHWQLPPFAQGKLVRALVGEILDVAVDMRVGSRTFGKHIAVVLSQENRKQLWIPPGFAHGFVVRSDKAFVLYRCTQPYRKEFERSVLWNDSALGIVWGVREPILSDRDASACTLAETDMAKTHKFINRHF